MTTPYRTESDRPSTGLRWRKMLDYRLTGSPNSAAERIENAQLHGAAQRVAVTAARIVAIDAPVGIARRAE